MKTTTKFFYVAIVLALFVSLYACKGPAGDVGPAGATGATGATGTTGSSGVIYSPWITATFSSTTYSSVITATQITQDILDKGDVRVYLKNGTTIFPLPYTEVDSSGYVFHISLAIAVGRIGIFTTDLIGSPQVRYVIIPGAIPSGRKAAVDFNNYEAVKKEFDLPD